MGFISLSVGVLSLLASFGITPMEAKQSVEVVATIVNKVVITVDDITANLDTEQIEKLNQTLIELSDPELINLFKLYLKQQTE